MDSQKASSRVHTFLALTALAFLSFIVIHSKGSGSQPIVLHSRREIQFSPRQIPSSASSLASSPAAGAPSASPNASSPSPDIISAPNSSSVFGSSSSERVAAADPSTSSQSSTPLPPPLSTSRASSQSSIIQSTSSTAVSSTRTTSTTSPIPRPAAPVQVVPSTTLTDAGTAQLTTLQTPSIKPSTSVSPSTISSASASSSRFWGNKAAVTATFVIVALVITAILGFLLITYLKRRNAGRHIRLLEDRPESFTSGEMRSTSHSSRGPSIIAAPMDAFARHEVGYDNVPDASRTPNAFIPSVPVQHPDYYNPPPTRYTPPSQLQTSNTDAVTAPVIRVHEARDSTGYQPSIDSFYGAGQPSPTS